MTKILGHASISLDGYMAGPDDEMDWIDSGEANPLVDDIVAETGAVVMGRHTFDVACRMEPFGAAYGGRWEGPHVVVTHAAPDPAAVPEGFDLRFCTDGIDRAVETAVSAANGKNVTLIGGDVFRQCLDRGLVDEIVVHVVPVLLGAGVPFFGARDTGRIELVPEPVAQVSDVVNLKYRPRR